MFQKFLLCITKILKEIFSNISFQPFSELTTGYTQEQLVRNIRLWNENFDEICEQKMFSLYSISVFSTCYVFLLSLCYACVVLACATRGF